MAHILVSNFYNNNFKVDLETSIENKNHQQLFIHRNRYAKQPHSDIKVNFTSTLKEIIKEARINFRRILKY